MSQPNPREVITTQALMIWIAAMAVYLVAITGRSSFGVAGLDAIERFDVDAGRIAVFTSVQLGVYAIAQIPTGMLIDKFGPRILLVVGAVIMGVGQVILGFTSNYGVAIFARVLIGAGDATGFLSVMRILPYWFPLHRTPMFTQVTSSIGQMGQFISAVPFLWLLGTAGWTAAFVTLGAVGILVAIAAAVAVADSPEKLGVIPLEKEPPNSQGSSIGARLKAVFTSPIAWQAYFIHYSGMLPLIVFVMLWGMPMMTQGMELSKGKASLVLTLLAVFLVLVGPLHGRISSRAQNIRPWVALGFVCLHVLTWVLFFAFGTGGGLAAITAVSFILALCTPTSNYGFDIIRENMDRSVVATATGLGNMGGFTSGMLGAQLFGMVLDHSADAPNYSMPDFTSASLAVLAVWLCGMAGVVITHILRRRGGYAGPSVRIVEVT
ncbi:MFS transporter [Corynebacterium accolens]|uniref:MFS transporter n=1 Tax=Corynebacterium accolens TaxID=38284 RepID=A0ABT7FQ45_9CORY|nr:MFS transporter [Corynebacterium accolens]MDK4247711.1 MFS transporter [Corynebacterium accolens]MDK4323941.1 MFS transporter [Corynebacterium accolens]